MFVRFIASEVPGLTGRFFMDSYLKSLAHEYMETIRMIGSGMYSESDLYDLESQRALLHDQIIDVLGINIPRRDMPNYIRNNVL